MIMICALYTPNVFVYIHITVIIVMIWLMYKEIVKPPAPIVLSLNLVCTLVASLVGLMASLVTTNRIQHCFNVPIDSYHEFLLLFYCCVLLEIKLTTTTTMSTMAWSLLYQRDFFVNSYDIHEHNTGSSKYLHLPLVYSNHSKSSIRYQGFFIWNKILTADINSDNIRNIFQDHAENGRVLSCNLRRWSKIISVLLFAYNCTAAAALLIYSTWIVHQITEPLEPLGCSSSHLPLYNIWCYWCVIGGASTVSMIIFLFVGSILGYVIRCIPILGWPSSGE